MRGGGATGIFVAILSSAHVSTAAEDPTKEQCVNANERAQNLRDKGKLQAARAELRGVHRDVLSLSRPPGLRGPDRRDRSRHADRGVRGDRRRRLRRRRREASSRRRAASRAASMGRPCPSILELMKFASSFPEGRSSRRRSSFARGRRLAVRGSFRRRLHPACDRSGLRIRHGRCGRSQPRSGNGPGPRRPIDLRRCGFWRVSRQPPRLYLRGRKRRRVGSRSGARLDGRVRRGICSRPGWRGAVDSGRSWDSPDTDALRGVAQLRRRCVLMPRALVAMLAMCAASRTIACADVWGFEDATLADGGRADASAAGKKTHDAGGDRGLSGADAPDAPADEVDAGAVVDAGTVADAGHDVAPGAPPPSPVCEPPCMPGATCMEAVGNVNVCVTSTSCSDSNSRAGRPCCVWLDPSSATGLCQASGPGGSARRQLSLQRFDAAERGPVQGVHQATRVSGGDR